MLKQRLEILKVGKTINKQIMLSKISNLNGVKVLNKEDLKKGLGGVPRGEYCDTLGGLLTGGGYQGDFSWGFQVFYENCGQHGYTLW